MSLINQHTLNVNMTYLTILLMLFFALLHDRYFIDGFFQKPNMHNDFQPDYAKCEHLIVMSLAIITCPFPWCTPVGVLIICSS